MCTFRGYLHTALLMPPKRGRDDGSPAKAPIQTHTKRTRRDNSPPSPSVSFATPTSNSGPSTGHNDPSHSPSADDDSSLIVDYNESTPLPSPHSGDEHSVLMGHDSPSGEASNLEEASMLPDSKSTVSSTAPSGVATDTERAAPKGTAAAQQKVGDSKSTASVGTDPEEGELKAPPTSQSASLARRREGG